jgi:CDP-diacylglycerol--serine O-phosphatidyltransferase
MLLVGRVGRRRSEAGAIGTTALVLPEPGDDGHSPGTVARNRFTRRSGAPPPRGQRHRVDRRDPLERLERDLADVFVGRPGTRAPGPAPVSIPLLPGERTRSRRLRFAAVNACTLSSLVLGIGAIFLAINHADVRWSALCLVACVAFDGLDGVLARRLGVASPFGAQMDSLADMCSFGIAAPVVVYASLAGAAPVGLLAPAGALVAVCAAIRLARFNVSPKDGRFFCGVPTTMAAAVLAVGTLVADSAPVALRVVAVALLALAMVSNFPYAKVGRLLRLPPWLLVVPIVGALLDYRLTFAGIVFSYLASGPLLWLRHRHQAVA